MDPDIAPLARRLAEENNVEWRRLEGSGTDGRIVERDVLDYLARVMAGEEDVNPTPEPLPEGMEAWTDDGSRPLGRATPSRPSAPADAPDTDAPHADAPEAGSPRGGSPDDATLEEDDLLLAGDDLLHQTDHGETDDAAEEDLLLAGGTDALRDAPGQGDSGDDARELPDLFDEDDARPGPSDGAPDLFVDDDADRGHEGFDFGGLPGADVRRPADQDETTDVGDASDAYAIGDDADALSFGDVEASGEIGGDESAAPVDAGERGLDEIEMDGPEMDGPEMDAAEAASITTERVDRRTPAASDAQPDVALPYDDAVPTTETASAVPSAADVQRWPLARTRTVVRRHVDVGELLAVRRSVALEAGMDEVAAVAVLFAAARRAADRLDAERPGIALPDGSGGVLTIVPEDGGLAEVGRAVDRAARGSHDHESADADLWVVDLAGVGVDEAVLDTDVAQLVLGRLLSDDSDGSVRATLSLVADVPVERGAAFLARVADLLEDPLRLLA